MDNSPAWDEALERVPVDQLPPYQRRDLTHVDSDQRPHSDEYDRYLTLVLRFRACGYDSARMVAESPFRVADLCTNAILLRADRDLLALAEALDLSAGREQLGGWIERGRAGFDQLWSAQHGGYRALDQRHDETIAVGISAGFLPLFAGGLDPERAQQLITTLEAWLGEVRRGVPSTDPGAAEYEPRRYWRGPIWLIVNWMIAEGLTSYDAHDLAERLRQGSLDLVSNAGFFEYFNPVSGEGLGGGNFSWTAAVTLFWLLASHR